MSLSAQLEWSRWLELVSKAGLKMGLWDWDLESNTVAWSDEMYRQFGFTRESFSGEVDLAVQRIHPEDRASVQAAIQRVLVGGLDYGATYRIMRPDGSICWVDAHGVLSRQTGPRHMVGISIDVSELKRAERSRIESEQKYLLLLNSTAEGIYGLDLNGCCTFANAASARLLGYGAPEELLGKRMHDLMHHTRPDGTHYPIAECGIYQALRRESGVHLQNELLWRADGTSFPAEYWSYPMFNDGVCVGAVVAFIDISDRLLVEQALKKSEERYRELFENAAYGMYRSDAEGALYYANRALMTMLGYQSKSELMQKNLTRDIYADPADREVVLKSVRRDRVDGFETRWKRKDDSIVHVRLSGRINSEDPQGPTYFDVVAEDITDRRNLEAQLLQAQKMEAVGLLAGGISHDFNNHLAVILGNTELLLSTATTPQQQKYAQAIRQASHRATQLTRQLLAFSRKDVRDPEVLNVGALVSGVSKLLPRLIGENIRIEIDASNDLYWIRADAGQMEQVLMNLATNARDAMPHGGTIRISAQNAIVTEKDAREHDQLNPGEYIRLSFSDTGVGMSDEVKTRAFEAFFTTKPLGHGTGLGLATVHSIVKESGGYVWIDSEVGQGTTFHLYLPKADPAAARKSSEQSGSGDVPQGTGTVLVIEDDADVREVTAEFLRASGYEVLVAASGAEALSLAQQYPGTIHLLLSDIVLPDKSGPSAVSALQALRPHTRVIYLSGYAELPVVKALTAKKR